MGNDKPSNLERMHGSRFEDALQKAPATKVELLARLIREINPRARITCIQGNILDDVVLDALLECDLLLGCTDSQHGRAALGDIAAHYLLPSIDVGVTVAAKAGKLKAQIVEICRHSPQLPCPFCLGRIDANLLSFELMTEEERSQRRQVAAAAEAEGIDGRAYWVGDPAPELTVGYLTTLAGSLAAGYAENLLMGAAEMPHQRFQFDVGLPRFGFNPVEKPRNPDCSCGKTIGYADQARADRSVSRPAHWPQPRILESPSAVSPCACAEFQKKLKNGVEYQLNMLYVGGTMEATFGQMLRELRRSKNVSQRDLAAKVGVDFSYISKLENDRLPPPAADTVMKICQALDSEPDALLSVTGKVPSDVKEMLTGNPSALQFVREAQRMGLASSDWDRLGRTLRRLRKG